MGIRCFDHVTPLYPQKLALTSPTGGGLSVGIVRSRTKGHGVFFLWLYLEVEIAYGDVYSCCACARYQSGARTLSVHWHSKTSKSRPIFFFCAQTVLLDVGYYLRLNSCIHFDWPHAYEQSSLKVI